MFDLTTFNWGSATLTVLFAIGAANVVMLWKPDIDSKTKFIISMVAAFVAHFIPAELGNIVLTAIKDAIGAAVVASGTYKLFTKAGGN